MASVLVVDDSAFVRVAFQHQWVQRGWRVVAVRDGEQALTTWRDVRPDLITLDVEMPGLSGLETLTALRAAGYGGPLIMVSSQTRSGAQVTLEALEHGADDFVPKPDAPARIGDTIDTLIARFHALVSDRALGNGAMAAVPRSEGPSLDGTHLRGLVLIASTGGPKALTTLLRGAPPPRMPVAVVQHMPAGFTGPFAERLSRLAGWPVTEVPPDGRPIAWPEEGAVLATGGRHLRLAPGRAWAVEGPRRHGVAPSADITLTDAVSMWGERLGIVVLTGMGDDGAAVAADAHRRGALVIAEAPSSAVVWGMPRAVVEAGAADAVWPLQRIRSWLTTVWGGGERHRAEPRTNPPPGYRRPAHS
jgi:two-component system chemotaxis response regulator CheB